MFRSSLLLSLFFTFAAEAAPLKKFELTPAQDAELRAHNRQTSQMLSPMATKVAPARPFSEVENAGYLFFSADTNFDSAEAKRIMAEKLPADVQLVVFMDRGDSKADVIRDYQDVIDVARLKVVELDRASRGFWARDGLPVPVWSTAKQMELVDARYYHGFEPDRALAGMFASSLRSHQYYFEGGNFMTNDEGACIIIDNNRAEEIPDSLFKETYGCTTLVRLPHEKGIGHIDESVRFLSSKVVVTDTPSYAPALRAKGFDVRILPRPERELETYVNALLVNGTIYVPVFGESTDEMALDVYRQAGLTVVPINTVELANGGSGSIHCITMTYPPVPFQSLLKMLGAREL